MPPLDDFLKSLSEDQREELARRALHELARKQLRPIYSDASKTIEVLRERREALKDKIEFKPGDIVCWKSGLQNRLRPADGEPAIVVDVLPEPRYDEQKNAGSSNYFEPLDLVLGLLDEDKDFMIFHFDSRRFEHFVSESRSDPT